MFKLVEFTYGFGGYFGGAKPPPDELHYASRNQFFNSSLAKSRMPVSLPALYTPRQTIQASGIF